MRNGRVAKRFAIRIAKYEIDVVNAFTIHMIDRIAAATAHADDFNDGGCRLRSAHTDVDE